MSTGVSGTNANAGDFELTQSTLEVHITDNGYFSGSQIDGGDTTVTFGNLKIANVGLTVLAPLVVHVDTKR
jgi:flagellar basal body rod protein FlgF